MSVGVRARLLPEPAPGPTGPVRQRLRAAAMTNHTPTPPCPRRHRRRARAALHRARRTEASRFIRDERPAPAWASPRRSRPTPTSSPSWTALRGAAPPPHPAGPPRRRHPRRGGRRRRRARPASRGSSTPSTARSTTSTRSRRMPCRWPSSSVTPGRRAGGRRSPAPSPTPACASCTTPAGAPVPGPAPRSRPTAWPRPARPCRRRTASAAPCSRPASATPRRSAPARPRCCCGSCPLVRDIRRIGSAALDLVRVADGSVDAYAETGLNAWDLAAGWLVVEEAGGVVVGAGEARRPARQPSPSPPGRRSSSRCAPSSSRRTARRLTVSPARGLRRRPTRPGRWGVAAAGRHGIRPLLSSLSLGRRSGRLERLELGDADAVLRGEPGERLQLTRCAPARGSRRRACRASARSPSASLTRCLIWSTNSVMGATSGLGCRSVESGDPTAP